MLLSKLHKVLFFFLIFLCFTIKAQENQKETDSIAKSFSEKAWDFYFKKNDSTLYYAEKGIEYSKKNNSTIGEIVNTEVKGVYLEEVKNNYKAAAEHYFKAIEIAERHQKGYLTSLYNDLCILFITTKDFKKASLYGKKAVETSKNGTRNHAKALVNYGVAQSMLGKYKEANSTLHQFLKNKTINLYNKNIAYLRIAKNYREQGDFKKAHPLFLKVVAPDSLRGQSKYNVDYTELINNFIKLKDKKTIITYINVLKKGLLKEKNLNVKQSAYKTLTNAYEFIGKPEIALKYQHQLLVFNDSLNVIRYQKGVIELETKYDTRKKEEQIIIEKNKRKFWLYLSLLAIAVLLFVAVLLYKNNQKRKLLRQSKLDLEKALNQRNMLLRETHHRVKNSFQMVSSLLQLQAQGSKAESGVKALENAVQRVNSMIVLHQQLYAKDDLLGIDLKVYINDLVEEILRAYPSEKIHINLDISSVILDIDIATSIGLLVNELATNSIKYAWKENNHEKKITIDISAKNNQLHFNMFDNGSKKRSTTTQTNYGTELIEILIERLEASKKEPKNNDFSLSLIFSSQQDDL